MRTYYRDRLDPIARQAYDLLCRGIQQRQREIPAGNCTDFSKVLPAVNYDHPEFFYVNWLDHVRFGSCGSSVLVRVSYLYSPNEVDSMQERIRRVARSIAGISDHGKALGVHDWLVEHIAYDHGGLKELIRSPEMFSAVGPLLHQKGVCEGVSKLACCLMREKGVDCRIVTGHSRQGVPHAWNAFIADGKTVYTDITYDMGLYRRYGPPSRRYFGLSREEMTRDHIFQYF